MKIEKDKIISAFAESLRGKRSSFSTVIFEESKKDEEPPKDEVVEFGGEEGKEEDLEKDSQDKADDILGQIDLKSLDNKAKIELISSVIDVLQDSCETDEEFSDYMNQILEVVNSFKFEKEGEEEEEGGEEEKKPKKKEGEEEEGGEEEPEKGAEGGAIPKTKLSAPAISPLK